MKKFLKFLIIFSILIAVGIYVTAPQIRDFYDSWKRSIATDWRLKWEAEQQIIKDEITDRNRHVRRFNCPIAGAGSTGEISIKAIEFNEVGFMISIQPFTLEDYEKLVTNKINNGNIITLNLRDKDGFAIDEVGFSEPIRIVDKSGTVMGVTFEGIRNLDLKILERVTEVDIMTPAQFGLK